MENKRQCPDAGTWKTFLDGDVLDDAAADLAAHLEDCEACQQTLERLAAGKETWEGTARQLAEADAENAVVGIESSGHLRDVLDDLKQGVDVGKAATASSRDVLRFLEPSDEPDSIGRLDSYEIHEVVGAGGMGVVLRGWDPTLRRVVAIKVLAAHLANSAAAERRFVREAQAAAAVTHDHVVAIHAVEAGHEPPYLVMQYIEGKTLQERLDATGPLDVKEILRIGQQTAQGLAAAHRQGIVHRDIKPANILLENGVERVRITDFGLARAIDDASMTQSGVVAGTPLFMAPEQAQGQPVDHRSDLFSLGSVLYAMAAGRPPFRSSTMMGVIRRVCDDEARPIREINPDVPDWLCGIIDRLLSKNPVERFQSADEVAELLAGCLAHVQHPLSVPLPPWAAAIVAEAQGESAADSARRSEEASGLIESRSFERSDPDDALIAEENEVLENARHLVRWPAVWLFVIAAINCVIMVALAGYLTVAADRGVRGGLDIVWLLVPFAPLCMIGATRMARLSGKVWAYAAVVMSLVGPGVVCALPIGIWALARLSRSEVSAGFEIVERRRRAGCSSQSSDSGLHLARVLIIGILWLMAIAIPLVFYVLVQDSGAFPNVGMPERMLLGMGALAVVFGLAFVLKRLERRRQLPSGEGGDQVKFVRQVRRVPEVLICTLLAVFTMQATYADLASLNYDRFMEAAVVPLFCVTLAALGMVVFINRRRMKELKAGGQEDSELTSAYRTAISVPLGLLVPVIVLLALWGYHQSTVGYVTFDVDDSMSTVSFRNTATGERRAWSASWQRVRLTAGNYEWSVSDGPMESMVIATGSIEVKPRVGQVLSARISKEESLRRLGGKWKYVSGSVKWNGDRDSIPGWARTPEKIEFQWVEGLGGYSVVFYLRGSDEGELYRVYLCEARADVSPKRISLFKQIPELPHEDWPCVADGYWRVGTMGLYLMLRPPGQPQLPSSYSIPVDRHVHYVFERVTDPEAREKQSTGRSEEELHRRIQMGLISAEVLAVQPARSGGRMYVEINVGSDDGYREGDDFTILRKNTGERDEYIAGIRLTLVQSDNSAGIVTERAKGKTVEPGDRAIYGNSTVPRRPEVENEADSSPQVIPSSEGRSSGELGLPDSL